jgi:hypothetical protein
VLKNLLSPEETDLVIIDEGFVGGRGHGEVGPSFLGISGRVASLERVSTEKHFQSFADLSLSSLTHAGLRYV